MCERTCPKCGSTEHVSAYGTIGSHIVCAWCCTILAVRREIEAAPTHMTEAEAEEWQREGTFVLPGAEAKDPADDALFVISSARGE